MLHYNFPPFSVGEVGFMRGAGRREIGHGALGGARSRSRDSRRQSIPLHDARGERHPGIERIQLHGFGMRRDASRSWTRARRLLSPVAGIAMGLVMEGKDYAVLTDIAGAEDHYGDMDFKVAGTKDGITALQMDIKVPNVTHALLTEALEQARKARLYILEKMNAVIEYAAHRCFRPTRRAFSRSRFRPIRSAS